jgi:chromosome segregation ATPase
MNDKEKKLEEIKEGIKNLDLKEEEKSDSFKKIEEWYLEDKALDELFVDLSKISETIKEYLAELGLV